MEKTGGGMVTCYPAPAGILRHHEAVTDAVRASPHPTKLGRCTIKPDSLQAAGIRTVGSRKERPVGMLASGELLAEGARFNDGLHRLPTDNTTFIPKGVYRFKTHEEANRHQLDCLAKGMARIALERLNGRDG